MRHRLFVESQIFTRLIGKYLDDDEYALLQRHLVNHPEAASSCSQLWWRAQTALERLKQRQERRCSVFAMTVHKSQGSEFERVLFVMPDRDVPVLTRELVYTAVTRAKESLEVWGREEFFKNAVSRRTIRASGLRDGLWE